ncbi:MAG: response regulator, partial [Woeseia sp.]
EYDCVLMDIQMPRLDGYAATKQVRETFSFDQLPVIAMTANVMAEDRARTLAAGMNGHVAKPVDPADLYQALLKAIPEGDYSGYLPAEADAEEAAAAPQAALPASMPGLAIDKGLSRVGGNEKLYLQLLGDMVRDYRGAADEIGALVATGKKDELRGAAHKVRGIANNLGAVDVGATAEVIEKAAIAGDDVSTEQVAALAQALKVVGQSHAQLLAELQSESVDKNANAIDVAEVFASLQTAVTAFDPGATDLVDQLLAAQEDDSEITDALSQVRELLDNFNFADAEPLLTQIEQRLTA